MQSIFLFLLCIKKNGAIKPHWYYTSTIASAGQTSTQVPHSVHASWSMTYLSFPSEIACDGHSAAQVPHIVHSSVILYAMYHSSYKKY